MFATLRDRHRPLRRPRPLGPALLAGVLAATLVTGCGSSEPVDGPTDTADGPRVAHPRFEGDFTIDAVELDGSATELVQQPRVTIETRFGGLTVQPGCNTYFGAFTLDEDGTASFTVTGGTDLDCGDLADQEAVVLAALDGATSWTPVDGGFRFDGPTSSLTITGPAG